MSSASSAAIGEHIFQLCVYQALHKTHLNLHEQAVHDRKRFQCPECEHTTIQKSSLIIHQKSVHMGQKFQ